jgi:hypothetical protein
MRSPCDGRGTTRARRSAPGRRRGVDVQHALQPAERLAVAAPALAFDEPKLDRLAVGQSDQRTRPLTKVGERRRQRLADALLRERIRLEPPRITVAQDAGAAERLVELAVRELELVLGVPLGLDAVAALDVLPVRDLATSEALRQDDKTRHLRGEPPGRIELGEQCLCIRSEPRRPNRILAADAINELLRARVSEDEFGLVLRKAPR